MSDNEMHVLQIILYGFIFLIIGLMCVQLCSKIKFPLTHHTFIIIAGAFIGQFSYLVPRLEDPMLIDHLGPLAFLQMYVPLLFFSSTVSTEVHYLKVMLFHLALTVVPTMILCCVVVTMVGFYLSPLNWAPEDYILMIAMTMTCGPQITKHFTSIMSAHIDLRNMVQSEYLFGNCLSYIFYRAVTSKLFKRPLYLVFLFMSDVVLGIFVGYIMGKLMMLWISKIFKDSVNQTTIILASIYAAFAICEIYRVSGMLCVVTMGLVVANQKASMSSQSMTALNKFVELLLFLFTSVGSVQTGIYLSVRVIPMLTVETLLVASGFYFLTFVLRSAVLILTIPFSSNYVNSRSLIYVMCVCHLRGTFSCMLSFTLMDTRLHATVNSSLFMITLLQLLMSFVINYASAVTTISYINMKLFSKDKVHMIERAAKMLIEEKRNTSHTLKRTMFTADADWSMVSSYTRLKTEFMKRYRNKSWLTTESNFTDPDLDAKRFQAIKRVVIGQKTCYVRLFEDGVLSRQSVLYLMIRVSEALKSKQIVNPYNIIAFSTIQTFLNKLEKDIFWILESGFDPLRFRIVLFLLVMIDLSIIVFTFCMQYFDKNNAKTYFLHGYNLFVYIIYICATIFGVLRDGCFSTENVWDRMNRGICLISTLDIVVSTIPYLLFANSSHLQEQWLNHDAYLFVVEVLTVSRLCRMLQLLRVSSALQQLLLIVVTRRMEERVFIGCDMTTGCVQGTRECLRKAHHITEESDIATAIKYSCHLCRLIFTQHLGLCQVDNPGVMMALKTKTAIRLLLNAQESSLEGIQQMGLLGEQDSGIIQKLIEKKMHEAQSFPYSLPLLNHRKVILHLPWVDGDEEFANYIEDNGHSILFSPNDIIITQGHDPGGIFIILNGLVRVEALIDTSEEQLETNPEKIRVPYYLRQCQKGAKEQIELYDFMARGCVIGEKSIMTCKPSHKTYRCSTYVETFYISKYHLVEMMEGEPDNRRPMKNLELKLWKTISMRQAIRMLLNELGGEQLTRSYVCNRMADADLIDGNMTKEINVSPSEVAALILIQGYARNYFNDIRYMGPCIIPYYVQKIISEPERGPRVIFLCIKNEHSEEGSHEEHLVSELAMQDEDLGADYDEELLTLSSGSSDCGPYRRSKKSKVQTVDKSVLFQRMLEVSSPTGPGSKTTSHVFKRRFSSDL